MKKEEEEKRKKENPLDDYNIELKSDEDFIQFAKINANRIQKAKPLPIFTLAYLQNIVELLGPTLDSKQIKNIMNSINNIFNNKLKEGVRTNTSKKANLKVGKINDRNDQIGKYDDDDDYDDNEEEEEEELNDIDIDKYK